MHVRVAWHGFDGVFLSLCRVGPGGELRPPMQGLLSAVDRIELLGGGLGDGLAAAL